MRRRYARAGVVLLFCFTASAGANPTSDSRFLFVASVCGWHILIRAMPGRKQKQKHRFAGNHSGQHLLLLPPPPPVSQLQPMSGDRPRNAILLLKKIEKTDQNVPGRLGLPRQSPVCPHSQHLGYTSILYRTPASDAHSVLAKSTPKSWHYRPGTVTLWFRVVPLDIAVLILYNSYQNLHYRCGCSRQSRIFCAVRTSYFLLRSLGVSVCTTAVVVHM